jgi:cell division protein FtsB
MRLLAFALAALLVVIQWPLWFGKGGWVRVNELQQQLVAQRAANTQTMARNEALAAELRSLREGRDAVEERARRELNMIRSDEVFFQVVPTAK